MAKAISNEELQLRKRARRRLVGAIAIVAIVVIFVPMILDNEPQPISQDISINLPPPSVVADNASASISDSEPSSESSAASASESAAESESGADSESGRLRFRPVEQPPVGRPIDESPSEPQTAAIAEPAQPAESEPAAPAEQSFVVQLGAFSDSRNATRLASTVRDNRFDAYTEVVTTSGGKRTRVRVGPYPTRAAAEQARDRLKARKLTYGEPVIVRLTN